MRKLTSAQQFFFDRAGFSYGPDESPESGRINCAIALAAAESIYLKAHRVAGVGIEWSHDIDGASDAVIDGVSFNTCEVACLYRDIEGTRLHGTIQTQHRHYLASCGAIWDADDSERRVIRAELALECEAQLLAIIGE